MIANINPETGIRYGVVSLNSLADWVFDSFFNEGTNDTFEAAVAEYRREHELSEDDEIPQEWYDSYECDEECYSLETEGMSLGLSYLGGAPLVWVFESPVIAEARECSPCCPNAGDLDNRIDGGFDCYSLPKEWWRDDA